MSISGQRFAIVVENDVYSIEVLGQYLEVLGIDYRPVADGKQLLELLSTVSKVDVIFIDLELAGQTGYSVLETIRREPTWDGVPIVAYTSHTHEKQQAREAGFHSFLGKPLSSSVFAGQLKNILNNEPVWE